MWSNQYYYLNICKDKELSTTFNTAILLKFLTSLPELQEENRYHFKNAHSFPFISLHVLYAKSYGSWADKDIHPHSSNLLTIVCAKDIPENFEKLTSLFIKITSFLNWQLINEQTDDGIEDAIIWEPIK